MRKLIRIALPLVVLFLVNACGVTETGVLVSESSDKTGQIKIYGKRLTSVEPFQTRIVVSGYNQSDTLMTEIYSSDLNNETVVFSWIDNSTCAVTFKQRDDSQRNMVIRFSENGNSLREK